MQFCELNAIYQHMYISVTKIGITETFSLSYKKIYTQLYNFTKILINDA